MHADKLAARFYASQAEPVKHHWPSTDRGYVECRDAGAG
jgi:hypothetical protein